MKKLFDNKYVYRGAIILLALALMGILILIEYDKDAAKDNLMADIVETTRFLWAIFLLLYSVFFLLKKKFDYVKSKMKNKSKE